MSALNARRYDYVVDKVEEDAHQLAGQAKNLRHLKFDPKSSEAAFSAVFLNFDKCRSEVAVVTSYPVWS